MCSFRGESPSFQSLCAIHTKYTETTTGSQTRSNPYSQNMISSQHTMPLNSTAFDAYTVILTWTTWSQPTNPLFLKIENHAIFTFSNVSCSSCICACLHGTPYHQNHPPIQFIRPHFVHCLYFAIPIVDLIQFSQCPQSICCNPFLARIWADRWDPSK